MLYATLGTMTPKYVLTRIRKPVQREQAARNMIIMLLSFAASVSITRLFLYLTGYPQIGNGELHIAHVLWGGLALFIATIIPIVYANRWAYTLSAITSGIGVGLFIDEVGKFITQSNDYFYPPAAPIIYAFFLLTVVLYLQIRRPPRTDSRSEMYRALDQLQEVLDHDLSAVEKSQLISRLHTITKDDSNPALARLAKEIIEFIESDALTTTDEKPDFITLLLTRIENFIREHLSRRAFRNSLIIGNIITGLVSLYTTAIVLVQVFSTAGFEAAITRLITGNLVHSTVSLNWYAARLTLETCVAIILFIAAGFLAAKNDQRGTRLSFLGLMLSLVAVNLLVFYFDQFSTIFIAGLQFILLLGVIYYQRRFLRDYSA